MVWLACLSSLSECHLQKDEACLFCSSFYRLYSVAAITVVANNPCCEERKSYQSRSGRGKAPKGKRATRLTAVMLLCNAPVRVRDVVPSTACTAVSASARVARAKTYLYIHVSIKCFFVFFLLCWSADAALAAVFVDTMPCRPIRRTFTIRFFPRYYW